MADDEDRFRATWPAELPVQRSRFDQELSVEPVLFARRISTRYPNSVVGQHLAFGCIADDGQYYFCKDDKDGHPVRATEWLATHLAQFVGLPTADCVVIEDEHDGTSFFGSRQIDSMADQNRVADFLATPSKSELGEPAAWPGAHLSMLRAFDLFVDMASLAEQVNGIGKMRPHFIASTQTKLALN